ncbi:protein CROWDED NUCLEI 1-like [Hyposmocoma kahamanoa]|uniref:protein CROWDED NUCLEI 1-like n=1 Tax=Hyposmocoma kahamanoa TaxID=1477025 RepID=UPI000E6D7257|nr:protein CROWDED NUCLEI 1-like [Hyposmocoma kahamanoa]
MNPKRYLCLPQNEWDRLKGQAATQKPVEDPKENIQQKLIEQSQEWIKTWPTSAQAQVANYEAKKAEKRQQDIDSVKAYLEKKKNKQRVDTEAMQKARQMIFNDSCYGRELLSALRYSRDREERQKQIELKQYIKEEAAKYEKVLDDKIAAMSDNIYNFGSRDQKREAELRHMDDKRRAHNKMMSETKKAQIKEEDRKKKLGALEDARLMKQFLEFEAHETDHCKHVIEAEMAQFKKDHRKAREESRKRNELDTAIMDVWRRHDDRVEHRKKKVLKEMHQEKHNTPLMKSAYEAVKTAIEKGEKVYNDFIDKGIKRYEEKCLKKEEKDKIDEINRKAKLLELAKEYKNTVRECDILENWSKAVCERYSLLPQKKAQKKIDEKDKEEHPPFLKECTTLRDALKKRSQEPTPWNALDSSHKYFAEQAEAVLAECKYKEMAEKVIADYRKNNCLEKLPSAKYNDRNETYYSCTCTK